MAPNASVGIRHDNLREERSEMICYVRVLTHARLRTTALDLRYARHTSIEAISRCLANETHETTIHSQWT